MGEAGQPPVYSAQAHEIAALLGALEIALRESGLWGGVAPSAECLASPLPFCVDTLRINEWLQWVFLPRMRALLRARAAMPVGCAIHPIATEQLGGEREAAPVLALLARIDVCLGKPPVRLH